MSAAPEKPGAVVLAFPSLVLGEGEVGQVWLCTKEGSVELPRRGKDVGAR